MTKNPIVLNGIDFIEYASSDSSELKNLFHKLGFEEIAHHKKKKISLFQQGNCKFVINEEKNSFAEDFYRLHGPSVCALGFGVKHAKQTLDWAKSHGASVVPNDPQSHSFPAIQGVGKSLIYLVENPNHWTENFQFKKPCSSSQVLFIDHLTHNVPTGEMELWCQFYNKIFNFTERKFFDIKGLKTGLISKVMTSPCNTITIPINEPAKNELGKKSQIQEYLDEYKGSGIQHIALNTKDIVSTVSHLTKQGIKFLDVPESYYEKLKERVPLIKEDLNDLKANLILGDGDNQGYLLQIFTKNVIGPIFYEIIQREGHDGFGEGNFQALFDAIELDQMKRGYLN